jgi:N utilization substance protein B
MGVRTRSRELALQALFFMDLQRDMSEEMVRRYQDNFNPPKNAVDFFNALVKGVIDSRLDIDAAIEQFSAHWKLHRISYVDRNALRIGVYELLFCPDIPPKVSINEAINLGKRFGTEESGAFINGILDSVRMAIERGEISGVEKIKFKERPAIGATKF